MTNLTNIGGGHMDKIDVTPSVDNDDTLFVKPLQRNWPSQFKFPQISHA